MSDVPDAAAMAALRAKRQRDGRLKTERARKALLSSGKTLPVRLYSDIFASPRHVQADPEVERCENDVWLVQRNAPIPYKVQRKRLAWTCSCEKWKKQRGIDCQHIEQVKDLEREPGSKPYSHARREPLPRIIYPSGDRSESIRRQNAYEAMPLRIPELADDLCALISEPTRRGPGAPRAPLALRAYALLMKAQLRGCSYEELSDWLREHDAAARFGFSGRICVNSLCNWSNDERLTDCLIEALASSARPGRRLEQMLLIDGTGRPTAFSGDWFAFKYGRMSRRVRPVFEYAKEHVIVGAETGLVAAVEFTLDEFLGSSDVVHLRTLLQKALEVFPEARMLVGDKAYGSKGNFEYCESMRVDLITRAKSNETRTKKPWPSSAGRIATMEREEPDAFNLLYNRRSRVEGSPSRSKRLNRQRKLRRRCTDPIVDLPKSGEEQRVTELSQEEIRAIVEDQARAVGVARINEGYAVYIVDNLRELVMLEELCDDRVRFGANTAFAPIPTERLSIAS